MSCSNNQQFLLASQRYYRTNQGSNPTNLAGYRNTRQGNRCGRTGANTGDVCPDRTVPNTIIDVLCDLINEQVEVTVPFGVVTGFLLDVKSDYIIMLEDNGDQVLVRTSNIESVSPIT